MADAFKSPQAAQRFREAYLEILAMWPVPNTHRRVETREGETFVIASGPEDAPPVVLLHGTMANSATWIREVALWSQAFRVYAVDIIGDAGFSAPSRPKLASDTHVLWLDDVLAGLGVGAASLVGLSFGGWLALDYAIRRPARVRSLVLMAPGGIGRQRNVLLWALPLLCLGPWGARKVRERIIGRGPADPSPQVQRFSDFMALIFRTMRPRTEALPRVDDAALKRLAMPLLVILGGRDVMVDSPGIRDRVTRCIPSAEIIYLSEARHYLGDQSVPVMDFLQRTAGNASPSD